MGFPPSPSKRTAATAPGTSRSRAYTRSSSNNTGNSGSGRPPHSDGDRPINNNKTPTTKSENVSVSQSKSSRGGSDSGSGSGSGSGPNGPSGAEAGGRQQGQGQESGGSENKRGSTAHASSRARSPPKSSSDTTSSTKQNSKGSNTPTKKPTTKNTIPLVVTEDAPSSALADATLHLHHDSKAKVNCSHTEDLDKGGVSVLDATVGVDDDPPPTYRSTDSVEDTKTNPADRPEHIVLFPLVAGRTLTQTLQLDTHHNNEASTPARNSQHQPPVASRTNSHHTIPDIAPSKPSKRPAETLSRLCQPKKFSRPPQNKRQLFKSTTTTVAAAASKKVPKVTSEYVIDLPMAKVTNTKEFKGSFAGSSGSSSKTAGDDSLMRLGSDNIHFHLLQATDTNSCSLLTTTPDTSPSSSSPAVSVSESGPGPGPGSPPRSGHSGSYSHRTGRQGERTSQSRASSSKSSIRGAGGGHAKSAWDAQTSPRLQPPTSPITRKKTTPAAAAVPSKENAHPRSLQNKNHSSSSGSSGQQGSKPSSVSSPNANPNQVEGPSVADLLWAQKRKTSPKTPPKSSKSGDIKHSPITKQSSAPTPSSSSSSSNNNSHAGGSTVTNRARSSGGRSIHSRLRSGHRSNNHNNHNNNNNNHHSHNNNHNSSSSRSCRDGVRSPVPTSAPPRTKRVLSQSLNGPPICE